MRKQPSRSPGVEEMVGVAEVRARYLDLLDRVHDEGRILVLTKRGLPVARVVPIAPAGRALRGSMRDAFEIVRDIVKVDGARDWEAVTRRGAVRKRHRP